MKCPFCAAEISPDAVICNSCGAFKVTRRSPMGVATGWLGLQGLVLMGIVWLPVLLLPFTPIGMADYPWWALALGTFIVIGLLWHSHSTRRSRWVRMTD